MYGSRTKAIKVTHDVRLIHKKELKGIFIMKDQGIRRGYIYQADLNPVFGSEQGGYRPVLVIQNNRGNKYSPTVIAAAITSQTNKTKLPTHIEIGENTSGLKSNSVVLTEQIRTIDKSRLKEKIGHIDDNTIINKLNNALGVSFGLE